MSSVPRRLVDELITGWELTRERSIVVEGPSDQRLLTLLQEEQHCGSAVQSLNLTPIDAVHVPDDAVIAEGLTIGAKQRVITFARIVSQTAASDGFRGVVDRDLDSLLGVDHSGDNLWYTDCSCLETYLWSEEVLGRLLIQYRCDTNVRGVAAVRRLMTSVDRCVLECAALRFVSSQEPAWNIGVVRSDKSLRIVDGKVVLSVDDLVKRSVSGAIRAQAQARVISVLAGWTAATARDVGNCHDRLWVVLFALRELSSLSRHLVGEEPVRGAMLAHGLRNEALWDEPLFARIKAWADS